MKKFSQVLLRVWASANIRRVSHQPTAARLGTRWTHATGRCAAFARYSRPHCARMRSRQRASLHSVAHFLSLVLSFSQSISFPLFASLSLPLSLYRSLSLFLFLSSSAFVSLSLFVFTPLSLISNAWWMFTVETLKINTYEVFSTMSFRLILQIRNQDDVLFLFYISVCFDDINQFQGSPVSLGFACFIFCWTQIKLYSR